MEAIEFDKNHWLQCGAIFGTVTKPLDVAYGTCQKMPDRGSPLVRWFSPSDFLNLSEADFGSFSYNEQIASRTILDRLDLGRRPHLSWQEPDPDLFTQHFLNVQKAIALGRVKKAVPCAFEKAELELDTEVLSYFLRQLLQANWPGFIFGHWDLSKGQGVLGLSPELLFSVGSDRTLLTMALAGTARNSGHNLLADPKERHEHQLVIESLVESLQGLGGVPQIEPTFEWRYGPLTHLRTDIHMSCSPSLGPFEVLKRLHPTPALGGFPKSEAVELLKEFALQLPRGQFGAPFGVERTTGESVFVVQIRCLIFRDSQVFLGSGCGVVEASERDREWTELSRKRWAVKQVFGLL